MACCGGFAALVGVVATGTSVGRVALGGTSGFGDYGLVVVAQLISQNGMTNRANLILSTGCRPADFVSCGGGLVTFVRVVATRASVCGVALGSTSRFGDDGFVIMSQLISQDGVTHGADLIFSTSSRRANFMPYRGGYVIRNFAVAKMTDAEGIAILGTSRLYNLRLKAT